MAMVKIDNDLRARMIQVGDVLMVAMELNDKHKKGKTFTWRFFALVIKTTRRAHHVMVVVLDEKEREPMTLPLQREDVVVHLLDEKSWPDGVHVFRTKLILDGRVETGLF